MPLSAVRLARLICFVEFSVSDLQDFLTEAMPYIMWMSVAGFAATTLQVLYR